MQTKMQTKNHELYQQKLLTPFLFLNQVYPESPPECSLTCQNNHTACLDLDQQANTLTATINNTIVSCEEYPLQDRAQQVHLVTSPLQGAATWRI